jgi:hypothetical protein
LSGGELCRDKSHANLYFEDEPGRRSAAKLLTKDEARRIAVNIAKLSETSLEQVETRQALGTVFHIEIDSPKL